jgi:hypothetical protein
VTKAKAPPGNTPSWFTPLRWWLELEHRLLRQRLIPRPFDFDPCGHAEAPVSREILRRGGTVFTAETNGLTTPWPKGAVTFWNPPYDSESMDAWAPVARGKAITRWCWVTGLLPAFTDRAWWHASIEPDRLTRRAHVEFAAGRLTFGWPGNPRALNADTAKFPSALVVWR